MRNLNSAWLSKIQQEDLTLAYCVRLVRRDGASITVTSHDEDLVIGANTYISRSAMDASSVSANITLGVDNLDVIGLIDSELITLSDIKNGLYDGATFELFIVDWLNIADGTVLLLKGTVGNAEIRDRNTFSVEFRSLAQALQQEIGDLTSRTCRVTRFGNSKCAPHGLFQNGNDITDYTFIASIDQVDSDIRIGVTGLTNPTGYFDNGVLSVTSLMSDNYGHEREIKSSVNLGAVTRVVLQEEFPFPLLVSDQISLIAGCQRRFYEDCRDKFSNQWNFQGEPHIAGIDPLLQRGRPNSEQSDEEN